MVNFKLSIITLVLSLLIAQPTFAAPEAKTDRGRLADGSAYRTSSDGFRITDRMAELEVTIDELKRQLLALENELEQKNQTILRLSKNGPAQAAVDEVSLVASNKKSANTKCSEFTQPLSAQVTSLEQRLMNARAELGSCLASGKEVNAVQAPETNALASLERALLQERTRSNALRSQLESLTAERNELKEAVRLASYRAQENSVQAREAITQATKTNRARMAVEPTPKVATETPDAPRLRNTIKKQFSSVQRLILKRKNLLDSAKARRSGVAIQVSALRTRSGTTLDTLRARFKSATSNAELQSVGRELREIEQVLNSDIEVFARLAKGRG